MHKICCARTSFANYWLHGVDEQTPGKANRNNLFLCTYIVFMNFNYLKVQDCVIHTN